MEFLFEKGEAVDYSTRSKLVEQLKTTNQNYRPFIYADEGGKLRIPGKLSVELPGTLANWKLPEPTRNQSPPESTKATTTSLAHVTNDASLMNQSLINVATGSKGEFSYGFYLTTGNETTPQERIQTKWRTKDKPFNEVVRFAVPNELIGKAVGDDENQKNFLIHVMQNSHSYPPNMTPDQIIGTINEINKKGHALIFPNDKDQKVNIDKDTQQSWHEYTAGNAAQSSHFIVIGPQRPDDLDGVRQIAIRNSAGQQLINQVPRSQQRLS
ncbi:hypothetical protein D7S89_17080 [Trinickia fusca]|uniref:Uncharacterized protein n=1 Tax=Trinickia fusca TaxID=2419777 RepID=A0A494XE00_9BURK|nr:hypothetical protein D7S89_17080 [Trinickia fusca]